jgi:uncharacterized protein YndB with AHSA1/START domain
MKPAPAAETQSIIVEYDLPHAPGKVWRALTDPALVERWLMPNDMRAEVGHRFTFRARPMPGWDGICHCEVLTVEEEKRLRYSWVGGTDGQDGIGSRLDSVVTWTLTPKGSGTLLRLEHTGFLPKNASALDIMGKGWRDHIAAKMAGVLASV